jgi:hypothetical protein
VRVILCAALLLGAGCSRRDAVPQMDAGAPAPPTASVAPPPEKLPSAATATHARAYFFNRRSIDCLGIVDEHDKLCASIEQPGVSLSDAQIRRALAAAREPPPSVDMEPWCFDPHHGIILYDANDAPVAAISVCFECQRESLWPRRRGEPLDPALPRAAEAAFRRLFCDDLGLSPCAPPPRTR